MFFIQTDTRIRVCKDFFIKTLAISNAVVDTALNGRNCVGDFIGSDGRGHAPSKNKTGLRETRAIRSHIESFPRIESHYCRSSTTRHYLDQNLNITKMYRLFQEKCREGAEEDFLQPVSPSIYRKVFCENIRIL